MTKELVKVVQKYSKPSIHHVPEPAEGNKIAINFHSRK